LAELRVKLSALGTPETEVLRKQTEGWAEAAANGKLDTTVVNWFVKFWEAARMVSIEARSPGPWQRAAEALDRLLLAEFRFTAFYPKTFEDFQGWVENVSRDARSSRVRRILRPGLHNAYKQLRLKAVVELE
jgi:hypothetical protein